MPRLFFLILFALCLQCSSIYAQNKLAKETPSQSKEISETAILYQQHILDSLVRMSLQNELVQVSGNSQRTRDLEAQLEKLRVKDSLSRLELMNKIRDLKKNGKGYAVAPFRDTIFLVYTRTASFTPSERAENITKRIIKIYSDPFFKPDSLKVVQTENGTVLSYNSDITVMVVTQVDAMLLDKDEMQVAAEYRAKIAASILAEQKANSLTNWLIRIGLILLIIAGLWLLIFLINKIFRWINGSLVKNRDKFLNGLTINKIRIFTPEHFETFVLRVSNLFRILFIILTVYLSLPLLFSIFPETKMWTSTLIGWVLSPARQGIKGIIGFLPNLFTIIVILLIFKYVLRGIKYFVNQIENGEIEIGGFHADWAHPTFRIMKFLLYAFMLVLIFPYLPGSDSSAFKGVSVFIGVLLSLGSSSAIANVVAGMVITYMRPFKIGDRVKIGEITGDVMEKTTLVTRIRTIKNEDVTVPNSTVLLSSTTNYSTNTLANANGLIIHTTVTIGYDIPWKDIHQALIDAALRTENILSNPVPFVLQISLDDFYVSYQINAYTKKANELASIYSRLHENIQDCCNEAGIEILSPHYRYQRDGSMTTIPANYLEKDYEAPAFRVRTVEENDSPASNIKNKRLG